MARDYKHRTRGSNRRAAASASPGWVWLVTGLALGLGVALGVHLHHTRAATLKQVVADSISPDPSPASEAGPAKPRFEFYKTLPKGQQIVSDEELRTKPTTRPARPGTQYFIQVGAFRRPNEADRLRAELALVGLEAEIQTSQDWHRVRLGPYRDVAALDHDRRRIPAGNKPLVFKREI
ncbi:MAG: SPOR domain-containing protein [Pseudomonadota bacterium]